MRCHENGIMGRYARCCPTLHSFETILLKLVKLGGRWVLYAVIAETLLAKHQLIVMKRSRQRATLSSLDRVVFGNYQALRLVALLPSFKL